MNTKPMSSNEKSNSYLVAAFLLVLGTPIFALGLFGLHFALTSYDALPAHVPASLFVMMVGGEAIWHATSLARETRRRPTRPY